MTTIYDQFGRTIDVPEPVEERRAGVTAAVAGAEWLWQALSELMPEIEARVPLDGDGTLADYQSWMPPGLPEALRDIDAAVIRLAVMRSAFEALGGGVTDAKEALRVG